MFHIFFCVHASIKETRCVGRGSRFLVRYVNGCYDHASYGIGLRFLFTVSFLSVQPSRTFRNVLSWPTYHRHDSYSRSPQYDVEWRSVFHELPGLSIWLHTLWPIYYKLYGIKYKYRVVAILYLQSCIRLSLDNPSIPLISCPVWALRSPLNSLPLNHWPPCSCSTKVLLTPSSPEPSSSWQWS